MASLQTATIDLHVTFDSFGTHAVPSESDLLAAYHALQAFTADNATLFSGFHEVTIEFGAECGGPE